MLAPVTMFVYNRPVHMEKALAALNRNRLADKTELYIFSDGAKSEKDQQRVSEVRSLLSIFQKNNSFKSVHIVEAEANKGLAVSVIEGVSSVIDKYGKIIVLEDDLITSSDFLLFMNECLDYFEKDGQIGAISGYSLPLEGLKGYDKDIYALRTGNSWGWATWKRVWKDADWEVSGYERFRKNAKERRLFDRQQAGISDMLDLQMQGKIDSWAVRWDFYFFTNHLLTVYPKISKVNNIGFDENGTHCRAEDEADFQVEARPERWKLLPLELDERLSEEAGNFYSGNRNYIKSMTLFCKRMIKKLVLALRGGVLKICKLETALAAIWVKKAFRREYRWRWEYSFGNVPDFFDHRIDLYWKWTAQGMPHWLERGVYSLKALKMFDEPRLLELCCGDGFNTKYFYATSCRYICACDYNKDALKLACSVNKAPNIEYEFCDIRYDLLNLPAVKKGKFTNIIWDASIAYFNNEEIEQIMFSIKKCLFEDGVVSGQTIIEEDHENFSLNINKFSSLEEIEAFFSPWFKHVYVFETVYSDRHNAFFYASDGLVPFCENK